MRKFILRIALLAAIITFVTCVFNGITLMTSLFRSAVVYLLTLLLVIITLNALRWGVMVTAPSPQIEEENKEVNQRKNE